MIKTSLGIFLALVEFEGWPFNYLDNWVGVNFIRDDMQKGMRDKGDRCCLQSSLCCVKVFHPHLTSHLCFSNPLSHLSCHGHNHPLQGSMGSKMINFL